jgi:hypothetical protein
MLFTLRIYLGSTITKSIIENIDTETIYIAYIGAIITLLFLYYLKTVEIVKKHERI